MAAEAEIEGQILALSGGGYRGLYTAKILACIEEATGQPVARHFDLLAGTSIGGILALALACEIPAASIVDLFELHGSAIFKKRSVGFFRSPYSPAPLARLLADPKLFGDRTIADCKHAVVIPAVSYTSGDPVMFKTSHSERFGRDRNRRLVDVALATSAAPSYFPRHAFDNTQYVDGGLIANAPGLIALHEMETVFGIPAQKVRLMSIGTMSSKQTANPSKNRRGGALDWGAGHWLAPIAMSKTLFGLAISAHETLTDYMLKQRLTDERYMHVDDIARDGAAKPIGLDKTNAAAREVLLGYASQRAKVLLGDPRAMAWLGYQARSRNFFTGQTMVQGDTYAQIS